MKKFGFIVACAALLCALPLPMKAASFSFNVLFDAASFMCRPCCPPPVIERHVYMAPCVPCYGPTVVKEYIHPYGCRGRHVIIHRAPPVPLVPCVPYYCY